MKSNKKNERNPQIHRQIKSTSCHESVTEPSSLVWRKFEAGKHTTMTAVVVSAHSRYHAVILLILIIIRPFHRSLVNEVEYE